MNRKNFNKSILCAYLLLPLVNVAFMLDKYGTFIFSYQTLLMISLAAIGEEIIFRFCLQNFLLSKAKLSVIISVWITNIIFALSHLLNLMSYASMGYVLVQVFCAFAVGVCLSVMYAKTRSLVSCIFLHILINLTSLGGESLNASGLLRLGFGESAVYLIVGIIYLYLSDKIYKKIKGEKNEIIY